MNLVEHAEYELKLGGFNLDVEDIKTDEDYASMCGKHALELIKVFASQGHSGFSAETTLQIFNRLVHHKPLTNNLSDNPDEWEDRSHMCEEKVWQSKRNSSCFTHDMKVYYDIDVPDNNVYELDKDGNKTGYCRLKPLSDRKLVELVHVES